MSNFDDIYRRYVVSNESGLFVASDNMPGIEFVLPREWAHRFTQAEAIDYIERHKTEKYFIEDAT